MVGVGWNAACRVEPFGGGDNLGNAGYAGDEQLHGEGDGQREREHNEGPVTDDQSAGADDYDIVAAGRYCGNCLFAGARGFRRIAALYVVVSGRIIAARVESFGRRDNRGLDWHAGSE